MKKKLSAMREVSVGMFNFNTPIDEDQYRHLGYVLKATNLKFEIENRFKKTIGNNVEKQVAVTVIHNDGRINPYVNLDPDDRWNVWYVLRVSKIGDVRYIEYNIQLYSSDVRVLNDALGCGEEYRRGYSGSFPLYLKISQRSLAFNSTMLCIPQSFFVYKKSLAK